MKTSEKELLKQIITQALGEDQGDGDHTSIACISPETKGAARLFVKENGILAGMTLAKMIVNTVDATIRFTALKKDGAAVKKGEVAFELWGPIRSILLSERLLLNCMQRMSGIATKTHFLVKQCEGTKAMVIDTRKTTPNMRFLEKWAVRIGGGANHRFGLYDMILIKDNHIDCAGGIEKAIALANAYKGKKGLKIEVEARSLDDVRKIMAIGRVHRIMLDNFTPGNLKKAVQLIQNKYETEASGGITEKNIKKYAKTGVNFISVGALTHSVKSLDLSLKARIA